ncbi:MAG: nuclease-related domain-containing protein [Methanoregula sp.]|jgi:uncharacterized protein (UPF0218 family)|uniref:nuclease-related domain-containing protein n=1 Tax=Methanoregula sp. TaxID=2052170 RepID=UPI003C26640D
MARIHRISGSTKYLLNGIKPINGKKPATLEELHHLHSHHEEILVETRIIITRQQDEKILELSNSESQLEQELQIGIVQRTQEVDRGINELNDKVNTAGNFVTKTVCRIHCWIAVSFRNHNIHHPFSRKVRVLHNIQYNKRKQIENKPSVITHECNNIVRSYEFLKNNESFLIGADGEEYVMNILSQLPDEYHVINDVNLYFQKAIHWRERNEYIKNCQIDHIVVGPTGIILVETKNWKASDIELKSDNLTHQVRRASLALWYYLKDYYQRGSSPKIQNVIVSMKGSPTGRKPDKFVDIVAPHQLCAYITSRRGQLSGDMINRLVDLLNRSPRQYPRF